MRWKGETAVGIEVNLDPFEVTVIGSVLETDDPAGVIRYTLSIRVPGSDAWADQTKLRVRVARNPNGGVPLGSRVQFPNGIFGHWAVHDDWQLETESLHVVDHAHPGPDVSPKRQAANRD